jgi:hypothetical protein
MGEDPHLSQDVYLGRRAANPGNVAALETYNPAPATDEQRGDEE